MKTETTGRTMTNRSMLLAAAVLLILVAAMSGCAWWDSIWGKEPRVRPTPEGLYQRGFEHYKKGDFKKAIEVFTRVRDEYPLHPVALMAELGIADSYFENEQYVDAEVAYGSFVELHPANPNVPYAMYQLGMCHYHQMQTIDRDQTEAQKARKEFERLIARFPQSKFAIMAEKNLREVKQRLAEHEFYVGEFYYRTKKYEAALKRFETIQREYANLGLDYKTNRFIEETKLRIREDAERKAKEAKKAEEARKAREAKEAQKSQKNNPPSQPGK
ncbi:MAG: Outer membrane protein assembly factor BamD precursor [Syntrophaceae bacterium PtaB.Bin038]|nr:MAG: Outer membrane protein assembly factor BamD precursor [Syntrophaceae bacterium PtaB.Bin038]